MMQQLLPAFAKKRLSTSFKPEYFADRGDVLQSSFINPPYAEHPYLPLSFPVCRGWPASQGSLLPPSFAAGEGECSGGDVGSLWNCCSSSR